MLSRSSTSGSFAEHIHKPDLLPQQTTISNISVKENSTAVALAINKAYFSAGLGIPLNGSLETKARSLAEIRDTFCDLNPARDRDDLLFAKGERVSGSCEWIEEHAVYNAWLGDAEDGQNRLVAIVGGPGTGKTMLSIFLTQRLEESSAKSNRIFLYFICRHDDKNRSTARGALRGLIWQLLGRPDIDLSKTQLANFVGGGEPRNLEATLSSPGGLWLVFEDLLSQVQSSAKPLILLDGLDECDADSVRFLAEKIQNSPKLNGNFLIVSRESPYLSRIAQIRMDEDSQTRDVQKFIRREVTQLAAICELETKFLSHIEETLLKKSEGTFLWAGFAVQELRRLYSSKQTITPTQINDTLSKFPAGLGTLYARAWREIASSEAATQLLRWVITALEPLSVRELEVLIGSQSTEHISAERATLDVIARCSPLLVVSQRGVAFVHLSARSYLTTARSPTELQTHPTMSEDHLSMAQVCLATLESVFTEHEYNSQRWDAKISEYPMLEYAIAYGFVHAARVGNPPKSLFDLNRPIFQHHSLTRRRWLQAYNATNARKVRPFDEESVLGLAAHFGITTLGSLALQSLSPAETPAQKMRRLILEPSRPSHVQHSVLSTALLLASVAGTQPMVEMLLKAGADPGGAVDSTGLTALSHAIQSGNGPLIDLLIEQKASINPSYVSVNATPLAVASYMGDEPLLVRLVRAGADVNAQVGLSPFVWAAIKNRQSVLKSLISLGADINAEDGQGNVPLAILIATRDENGVRLLLQHGANPNDNPLTLPVVQQRLLNLGADVDGVGGPRKNTTLHMAAGIGEDTIVQLLLDAGAKVDHPNQYGHTALHHASVGGHLACARTLLARNAALNQADSQGYTPMHTSAAQGHDAVVVLLLRHGADIHAKALDGFTALHLAAMNGNVATIKALLGASARLDEPSQRCVTPLHIALMRGHDEVVQLLVEKGADILAGDHLGFRAIHYAALENREMAMKLLLEGGCNINITTHDNLTPLGVATEAKFEGLVRLLLERGADPNIEANTLGTALDISEFNKTTSLSLLLREHGARHRKREWQLNWRSLLGID